MLSLYYTPKQISHRVVHHMRIKYKILPTLIRILQRIVEAVGVAVEVLGARRILYHRVGHQEAAEGGVVQALRSIAPVPKTCQNGHRPIKFYPSVPKKPLFGHGISGIEGVAVDKPEAAHCR